MYSKCRLLANDSTRHAWRRWIRSTVVSQGERRGSEEGREAANREMGTHGTAENELLPRWMRHRAGAGTAWRPGGAWCRPCWSREGQGWCGVQATKRPGEMGLRA